MREYQNKRNPILPLDICIPDGEGHVMPDGRLYIYGSFDDRDDVYCSEKYHVVSTPDMEHWEIHEISLHGRQIPWFNNPYTPKYQGIDWSNPTPFIRKLLDEAKAQGEPRNEASGREEALKPPLLFAPDCISKGGKYYLYFCMSDDSEGVAISAAPEGPFMNPIQLPCGGIDPAIFIDDDGQPYYYWGQVFSHGVRLNPDMVSFHPTEAPVLLLTEEEHFFHEGSSMRKIGEIYYYVYADMERGKPTALGYSISKSPLGPFEYKGIIIDNADCDPESWNNHGSIECVNGQWYVFYHRCSRGTRQHRRLCIEPITIHPDGTIDEVRMTSQGLGKPFASGEKIMGYQACGLKGSIYIGADEKDGAYAEKLMNISDGDEAVFRYMRSEADIFKIEFDAKGTGIAEVFMDEVPAGTVEIKAGIQQSTEIYMTAGMYELKLRFRNVESLEIWGVAVF